MKDWVKEKLKIIDELYPADRVERSKDRWRRMWRGEKPLDRYPFVFVPLTFNYYDDVFTKEEGLKAYLNEFIIRGKINDDFIPAFFPGCKQGTIPNMFGSKELVTGKDHSCEKIIFDYKDIDKLPEPSVGTGTIAYEWLKMQEYYLQETEGKIPVHVADTQGPMDVCGQLWGYDNVFIAPYEEPEYYHKLMSKVKDAFIMFWEKQKELLGEHFVGTHLFGWDWVPEDAGASLSADSMSMMSPAFFEDYYRQYIEEIGNTFGGLSVHSCGDFSAVVKSLCSIPCVKAVNAGQMSVDKLLEAGLDTNKVVISFEGVDYIEKVFELVRIHKLRPNMTLCGIWPTKDGKLINSEFWTKTEWDHIKRIESRVIEEASKI
jgi:hypothetical protein